ncbi:hypothetical protein AB4Z48_25835 [Cupriavidus sp. 2TAF22]|uniref:hypothetical protein n=1 Tax=unclassified Cupriavidus TaxID=2640874 RepID=UPI003F90626A
MTRNDGLPAQAAVALRRMIGSKEISPVQLLEACQARAAEHAVLGGARPAPL